MKKCPFCAEEIQDEAILCRYCKSDLRKANTGYPSKSEGKDKIKNKSDTLEHNKRGSLKKGNKFHRGISKILRILFFVGIASMIGHVLWIVILGSLFQELGVNADSTLVKMIVFLAIYIIDKRRREKNKKDVLKGVLTCLAVYIGVLLIGSILFSIIASFGY